MGRFIIMSMVLIALGGYSGRGNQEKIGGFAQVYGLLETGNFSQVAKIIKQGRNSAEAQVGQLYFQALLDFYLGRYQQAHQQLDTIKRAWTESKVGQVKKAVSGALGLDSFMNDVSSLAIRSANIVKSTGPFRQKSSRYFEVFFHHSKDEILADELVKQMDPIFIRLAKLFGYPFSRLERKIRIELYSNMEGFSASTGVPLHSLNASGTVAICKYHRLMLSSPKLYSLGYHFVRTVTHELVHFFLIQATDNKMPLWLHEGMAKYFENYWEENPQLGVSVSMGSILAKALKDDALIPLKKMSPSFAFLKDGENITAFAQVFTIVKWLIDQYGLTAFQNFVKSIGQVKNATIALEQVYQLDVDGLLVKWKRWITGQSYEIIAELPELIPRVAINEEQLPDQQAKKTPSGTGAVISTAGKLKLLGNLLFDIDRRRAAQIEFEKAYRLAPQNLSILKKLTFITVKNQAFAQAEQYIAGGLDRYREDYFFLYWKGVMLNQQNKLKEAQNVLHQAFMHNPFDRSTIAELISVYEKAADQINKKRFSDHFALLLKGG